MNDETTITNTDAAPLAPILEGEAAVNPESPKVEDQADAEVLEFVQEENF